MSRRDRHLSVLSPASRAASFPHTGCIATVSDVRQVGEDVVIAASRVRAPTWGGREGGREGGGGEIVHV